MSKKLLMGNEAFAHAALEAGVRVVAGYPGTPSSELIETVAKLHAAGKAHGVIPVGRAGNIFGYIRRVSGNPSGDNALLNIV